MEIHLGRKLGKFNSLHKCDNPPCVNYEHLYEGTQGDNIRDMFNRKRTKDFKARSQLMRNIRMSRRKLSLLHELIIVTQYKAGVKQRVLANYFNISQAAVSYLVRQHDKREQNGLS